jgi:hypothetical protein
MNIRITNIEVSALVTSAEKYSSIIRDEIKEHFGKTRNQIPSREEDGKAVFLHHAGILLLLHMIFNVTEGLPLRHLSSQRLMSALLGAGNIERSGRQPVGLKNGRDCG